MVTIVLYFILFCKVKKKATFQISSNDASWVGVIFIPSRQIKSFRDKKRKDIFAWSLCNLSAIASTHYFFCLALETATGKMPSSTFDKAFTGHSCAASVFARLQKSIVQKIHIKPYRTTYLNCFYQHFHKIWKKYLHGSSLE